MVDTPKLDETAKWGVRMPNDDQPASATFVIDSSGIITWRKIGVEGSHWPTYPELAAALGT